MKIVITGGHLSPAFSVIEKLKDENVLFIGRKHALTDDNALSLEYQLCQKYNILLEEIKTAKLNRTSLGKTILSLFNLPVGVVSAMSILKRFKPDAVLGFGGYVSLPVIFAAKILKIPVVIHEQTFEAGVANKIAGKFADKVCISWSSSEKFFPKSKTVLTGNPLRSGFLNTKGNIDSMFSFKNKTLPTVYITGGSLGSHAINILVEKSLSSLLKLANVIHQTGDAKQYLDFDRLQKEESDRYVVKKFFTVDDLADIYQATDLVVARSGANTLTELMYFKKPALLIPLPIGQKNEQLKNALVYKELGFAEIINQDNLSEEIFLNVVKQMLSNLDKYKKNEAIKNMIKKNAAEEIIKVLKHVARS
jgi:UDP-N-acetylglucosamine--N-acetylmuramyl-(pentapeptide) pyrophosphoryl-undecaprenol N-acetylglucosamine transferase